MGRRFVLVHSPSVGPTTWEPVAEFLQSAGHLASVPNLLGVAQSGPPFWPAIMAEVATAIEGGEGQAVVVMHSNAGLFASQFAASSRTAVAGLVFVDASVPPESGEADVVPSAFLAELRAKPGSTALIG